MKRPSDNLRDRLKWLATRIPLTAGMIIASVILIVLVAVFSLA